MNNRPPEGPKPLEHITLFLLDMDGTFYLGDRIIDGALDFLDALKRLGRRAVFLTNNSSRSAAFYGEKLRRLGVPDPVPPVITSGGATARHLLRHRPGARVFLLGNRMLREEMASLGLHITRRKPDCVVIAYDTELTYDKLHETCNHIRAGLPYIATHPDLNCPTQEGFAPDIGAIIAFIRASTGREPDLVVGKPNRVIMEDAMALADARPQTTAIVGDRLYTDIRAGLLHGLTSVLVLSGETTPELLGTSPIQPDFTAERLDALIPLLG